jgi:hypothetical protein
MPYRIAGIDVHKKMLAVVVADVEVDGDCHFDRPAYPGECRFSGASCFSPIVPTQLVIRSQLGRGVRRSEQRPPICADWPSGWSSRTSRKSSWSRPHNTGGRCGRLWNSNWCVRRSVVDGDSALLLASEVAFGCLNGDVAG